MALRAGRAVKRGLTVAGLKVLPHCRREALWLRVLLVVSEHRVTMSVMPLRHQGMALGLAWLPRAQPLPCRLRCEA